MNEQQANKVYDILVQHAGEQESGYSRNDFVYHQTQGFVSEYRFQGGLGFGGKIYREARGFRVSCYPEDRNAKRIAMIYETNKALAELDFR